MIDDTFVSSLPDEPFSALKAVSEAFFSFFDENSPVAQDSIGDFNTGCLEYYGLVRAIIAENNLDIKTGLPSIIYDDSQNITNVREFFINLTREASTKYNLVILDKSINKYKNIISTGFKYEFSEKEVKGTSKNPCPQA